MKMKRNIACIKKQAGVLSLFFALILMTITGLALTYTLRDGLSEIRLSTNEVRKKQALAAADSGLNHALAYLRNGGVYHGDYDEYDGYDDVAPVTLYSTGQQGSQYTISFCSPEPEPSEPSLEDISCPATPGPVNNCAPLKRSQFNIPVIASCGWSDDSSSSILLTQIAGNSPSIPGNVNTPVITRGATNVLVGGASILNYFNDLTVWAGGSVTSQSATGKTFIRDLETDPSPTRTTFRDVGNSPACNNPPAGYACSTEGGKIGHDTIEYDTRIGSMTKEDFFIEYMGGTYDYYRTNVATWVVKVNSSSTITNFDSTDISTLEGKGNETIWVEGDVSSLPGNIGSVENPVVIVVNGDLTLRNEVINGLVFVTGKIHANGNAKIFGALIGSDDADASGNMLVVFDPNVLNAAKNTGQFAILQGSWKDW